MPDETTNDAEENEGKPTITIAEKESGDVTEARPTITIAEREDSE